MRKTAKIEHPMLDSKNATAVALFNEWIKWCGDNGVLARKIPLITQLFEVSPDEYKEMERWEKQE